jgi:hypothetical protein
MGDELATLPPHQPLPPKLKWLKLKMKEMVTLTHVPQA